MVDAKSGSNLLYLPLDKLIAQAAATDAQATAARAAAAAQAAGGSPATSATLPSDLIPSVEVNRLRDPRTRESLRDRESR
jgi:membrane protease subunit HflK